MLVVGSKALKYNYPNLDKIPKDTDVIGSKEDAQYLIELLNPSSSKEGDGIISLYDIQNKNEIFDTRNVEILLTDNSVANSLYIEKEKAKYDLKYASPETLFSLKKSHIHFPIKFKKHINDYCFLSEKLNNNDVLKDITKIAFSETESRLGKLKTPSLMKSTKSFFGQSTKFVKSYFIHDEMHEMVAHYDKPIYNRMLETKDSVKCLKPLWDIFSYEDKCKCVLEEAYVIALERKVLPALFGGQPFFTSVESIEWALMRICTTLCSGWFRQFATDNYVKIYEMYNRNYVEDFLTKYKLGLIKKIQ
jgi:hypothetical protein